MNYFTFCFHTIFWAFDRVLKIINIFLGFKFPPFCLGFGIVYVYIFVSLFYFFLTCFVKQQWHWLFLYYVRFAATDQPWDMPSHDYLSISCLIKNLSMDLKNLIFSCWYSEQAKSRQLWKISCFEYSSPIDDFHFFLLHYFYEYFSNNYVRPSTYLFSAKTKNSRVRKIAWGTNVYEVRDFTSTHRMCCSMGI